MQADDILDQAAIEVEPVPPEGAQAQGQSLWKKACSLHLENKFEEAEKLYTQLLEQNHENTGLMATLGSLYVQTKRFGLAIHFLESAIAKGLKQHDAFTNLALAYTQCHMRDKARHYFEKSIEEEATPEALTNYSAMFIEAGEAKKCAALCEEAIAENPNLPLAHWNLALSLLGDGVWERAWDEHEWGLKGNFMREDRVVLDVPIWDGTKGKTVLVYGEQGLGDEIMFASMLPDLLATNKVVFECHKKLGTLFRKSFPEIPVYGTREDRVVDWAENHPIDYRLCIGSLGKFYRRSREAFPGTAYLSADPLPKEGFRVGISWKGGGAKLGRVAKRSVPLSWWKPILNIPGIEFVSLQYGLGKEQDLDMADALGYNIKRMDEYADSDDYYETARLVKSCDLIISVCTSLVHLSGALGVPCWVLTPRYPAWRYQNQVPMPWYRSVRLYRSPSVEREAWYPVLDRIGYDLERLVSTDKQKVA